MRRYIVSITVGVGLLSALVGGAGLAPDASRTAEHAGIPPSLSVVLSVSLMALGLWAVWRAKAAALPLALLLSSFAALTGYHLYFILDAAPHAPCGCLSLVGSPTHAHMLMICSGLMMLCAVALLLTPPTRERAPSTPRWPLLAIAGVGLGLLVALQVRRPDVDAYAPTGDSATNSARDYDEPVRLRSPDVADPPSESSETEMPPEPAVHRATGWTLSIRVHVSVPEMHGLTGKIRVLDTAADEVLVTKDFKATEDSDVVIEELEPGQSSPRPGLVVAEVPGCTARAASIVWSGRTGTCTVTLPVGTPFVGSVVDGHNRPISGIRVGLSTARDGRHLHRALSRVQAVARDAARVATVVTGDNGEFVVHGWNDQDAQIEVLDAGWYPLDWTGGESTWRVSSSARPKRRAYPAREPAALVVGRVLAARLRVCVADGTGQVLDCIEDGLGVEIRVVAGAPPDIAGGPMPFDFSSSRLRPGEKASYAVATWLTPDSAVNPESLAPVEARVSGPGIEPTPALVPWKFLEDARHPSLLSINATAGLGGADIRLLGAPEGLLGATATVSYRGEDPGTAMRVFARVVEGSVLRLPSRLPAGRVTLTCRLWDGDVGVTVPSAGRAVASAQCRPLCGIRIAVLDGENGDPLSRYGLAARDASRRKLRFRPRDGIDNWQSGGTKAAVVDEGERKTYWLRWPMPPVRLTVAATGYSVESQVVEPEAGRVVDVSVALRR